LKISQCKGKKEDKERRPMQADPRRRKREKKKREKEKRPARLPSWRKRDRLEKARPWALSVARGTRAVFRDALVVVVGITIRVTIAADVRSQRRCCVLVLM
jgi:hypothetical protein